MARPKKGEEKPKDEAVLQISIEEFIRTRDSVVTGLATLQSAVQDLSRAYITHTNTVLGRAPGSRLELMSLANPLGDNGLLGPRAATPAAGTELGDGKKKRKRTPPDPDAPKRPLTPYFLYMKTARPLIAMDVPGNTTPKEIAEEGTRRWAKMGEGERFLWGNHYIGNLAKYREQVFEYKAGRGIPDLDNISEEAVKLLIEKHIPLSRRQAGHVLPDIVGDVAEEESDEEIEEVAHEDVLEEVEEEEDEEPSPPPKAPSPPKSPKVHKRRKTTKDAAEAKKPSPIKETPIPVPGSSSKEAAAPVRSIDDEEDDDDEEGKGRKPKTPEKKKRGPKAKGKDSIAAEKAEKSKKEVVEEAKSSPKGESQDSQKKEKKTRKKRKSEATEN